MLSNGTLAIALIKQRIVIVQSVRNHGRSDKYLDIITFDPFGECIFLPSQVPTARIQSSDVLQILSNEAARVAQTDILEVPVDFFNQYISFRTRQQPKRESLWCSLISAY